MHGIDHARRQGEFAELARSAGAEVLAVLDARVSEPNPRYFIGAGKADEVAEAVREHKADLVLVDHVLSP
ncbi:MAG: GTPase HflX, partial [Rhodanobacteraceae bacterium]